MYIDIILKINQAIMELEEPIRLLCYLSLYIGIPLLCVVLYYIDNKITISRSENKKKKVYKKIYK